MTDGDDEPDLESLAAVRSVDDLTEKTRPWFVLGEPVVTNRFETYAVLDDDDDLDAPAAGAVTWS